MSDEIDLLERATRSAADAVAAVKPTDLDAATPCTEWTVRDLLNHMVGTALMFGSSANGERSTVNPFGSPENVIGDDARAAYDDAVRELLSAWRSRGVDGEVPLLQGETPAVAAITICMCDQLLHGWDLANAIGVDFPADDDVIRAAQEFTRANMSPERRGPGKGFAHPVDAPPDASRMDQLAAFTGRQPMTA